MPLATWRTPILRAYVLGLMLRLDAPFPSQVKDRAKRFLRLRVVSQ